MKTGRVQLPALTQTSAATRTDSDSAATRTGTDNF